MIPPVIQRVTIAKIIENLQSITYQSFYKVVWYRFRTKSALFYRHGFYLEP